MLNNRNNPTPKNFNSDAFDLANKPHFASPEGTRWAEIDDDTGLPMTPTFGPGGRGELSETRNMGRIGSAGNALAGNFNNPRYVTSNGAYGNGPWGGKKTRRRASMKRRGKKTHRRGNKNRKTKRRSSK